MEKRKTDLVVTGYVFDNEKRLLLIHHAKLNLWLPVGGHIEKDETPDEALRREIKEETNLNVELLNKSKIPLEENVKENLTVPFYVNVHSVGDHDHCSFFYVCKTLNPERLKTNEETKGFMWIKKEELDKDIIPRDVRNIALEAFKFIE